MHPYSSIDTTADWKKLRFCRIYIYIYIYSTEPVEYTDCIWAKEEDNPTLEYRGYDIKESDTEIPVLLELWGNAEYPFIAIAPTSNLIRSGSTSKSPINALNRTVWHLICVQTNELCKIELLEIELFLHLTVCKQMTDVE